MVHDNAQSAEHYLPETLGPGCAFLDYDNDGWMDIYLVNSGPCDFWKPAKPVRNALYKNNRDGTFSDITDCAGVATPGWTTSAVWFDYDNDGPLDLFLCSFVDYSGTSSNAATTRWASVIIAFHGCLWGRRAFSITTTETARLPTFSAEAGPAFQKPLAARGLAVGDFDNDGAVDVLVANNGGAPLLLKNNAGKGNNWLGVKLEGVTCNRDAVGARIYWIAAGKRRFRLKNSGGSYLSSHDPREVLGVGKAEKVEVLEIHWPAPSARIERVENVAVNRYVRIVEGKGIVSS